MKRNIKFSALCVPVLCLTAFAQESTQNPNQERPKESAIKRVPSARSGQGSVSTAIGRIVKIQPELRSIDVTTDQGTQVTFYVDGQTTYKVGTRDPGLANLRAGEQVEVSFGLQGEKMVLQTIELRDGKDKQIAVAPMSRRVATGESSTVVDLRGRVTRILKDPDQIVFVTENGREMILNLDSDRNIQVSIEVRNGKQYIVGLQQLEMTAAVPVAAEGITVIGTISRVELDDGLIEFRTAEGEDIKLFTNGNSKFAIGDKTLKMSELNPGAKATVIFESKDQRRLVRSLALDNAVSRQPRQ